MVIGMCFALWTAIFGGSSGNPASDRVPIEHAPGNFAKNGACKVDSDRPGRLAWEGVRGGIPPGVVPGKEIMGLVLQAKLQGGRSKNKWLPTLVGIQARKFGGAIVGQIPIKEKGVTAQSL